MKHEPLGARRSWPAAAGLGKAIAARLIADGADVMLTARAGRVAGGGEELAAAGAGPGQRVVWQAGDVAVGEDVERLVAATVEQLGRSTCSSATPASTARSG